MTLATLIESYENLTNSQHNFFENDETARRAFNLFTYSIQSFLLYRISLDSVLINDGFDKFVEIFFSLGLQVLKNMAYSPEKTNLILNKLNELYYQVDLNLKHPGKSNDVSRSYQELVTALRDSSAARAHICVGSPLTYFFQLGKRLDNHTQLAEKEASKLTELKKTLLDLGFNTFLDKAHIQLV